MRISDWSSDVCSSDLRAGQDDSSEERSLDLIGCVLILEGVQDREGRHFERGQRTTERDPIMDRVGVHVMLQNVAVSIRRWWALIGTFHKSAPAAAPPRVQKMMSMSEPWDSTEPSSVISRVSPKAEPSKAPEGTVTVPPRVAATRD